MEDAQKDPLHIPSGLSPERIEDELDQLAAYGEFPSCGVANSNPLRRRGQRDSAARSCGRCSCRLDRELRCSRLSRRDARVAATQCVTLWRLWSISGEWTSSGFDPSRGFDPIERCHKKQERGA